MLAAFIMTKDEYTVLHKCIENIAPVVDIIFVIDGGSTDGTWEYLNTVEKCACYQYPWDYGDPHMCMNQRNRLLQHINEYFGGLPDPFWIVMIDSDETFSDGLLQFLEKREFMQEKALGYWFRRLNLTPGVGYTMYPNTEPMLCDSKEAVERFLDKYPDNQLRLFKYTGTERYISPPHEAIELFRTKPHKLAWITPHIIHQKADIADNNCEYFTTLQNIVDGRAEHSFFHRGKFIYCGRWEGVMQSDAIESAKGIIGWMDDAELQWLAEKASQANVIVEVGSYAGRSTKVLAQCAKQKVIAIDPWAGNFYNSATQQWEYKSDEPNIYELFQQNLAPEIAAGKVEMLRMTSEQAAEELRSRGLKADMVFIDGDHVHPGIDYDLMTYGAFVRSGGIFCGHDASSAFPDLLEALTQYVPGWKQSGSGAIWYRVR